jgi:drug/metabolite transporter (DMT)-like permease
VAAAFSVKTLGVAASTGAAFLWSTYYFFLVLGLPRAPLAPTLIVPFLAGGLGFLALTAGERGGGVRRVFTMMTTGPGLLRAALLVFMQLDVVLVTRLAGPVTTALITLLADVVATPLLLYIVWGEGRLRLAHPPFWVGVMLSSLGATLTILIGHTLAFGIPALLAGLPLPFLVAFYFLLLNQAGRKDPLPVVVGSASLLGTAFTAVGATLLLGPVAAFGGISLVQYGILVVMGLTSFWLGPWAYLWAAERLSIVIPSVLQAFIPVFTLLLGFLLLPAETPWIAIVGVPLAFVGSVLAIRDPPHRSGAPRAGSPLRVAPSEAK